MRVLIVLHPLPLRPFQFGFHPFNKGGLHRSFPLGVGYGLRELVPVAEVVAYIPWAKASNGTAAIWALCWKSIRARGDGEGADDVVAAVWPRLASVIEPPAVRRFVAVV